MRNHFYQGQAYPEGTVEPKIKIIPILVRYRDDG